MRFYSFTNFYFQGIHAGIQTAHAVHEMESRYRNTFNPCLSVYQEWALKHKTIIIKKVAAPDVHKALQDLYNALESLAVSLKLPLVLCNEPSANHCNTAVGIVLPESVYDWKDPNSNVGVTITRSCVGTYALPPPMTTEQKLKQIIDSYWMAN